MASTTSLSLTTIAMSSDPSVPGLCEISIPRPIHLTHSAFADLGGDRVRAEGGAEVKWHLVCRDEALEFLEPILDHDRPGRFGFAGRQADNERLSVR